MKLARRLVPLFIATIFSMSALVVAAVPASAAPGVADHLAFTMQPSDSTGGVVFANQPVVTVEDSDGNAVPTDTSTITLSIASGTTAMGGPARLHCDGGHAKTAAAGVATYVGCRIAAVGVYTLGATASGLPTALSASVSITAGPGTHLVFTTQPSVSSTGGVAFAQQPVVTVEDAGDNVATADASTLTLSIATGGTGGLSCTGGRAQGAVAGRVAFVGCAIDRMGVYTLDASAPGLTSATSGAVIVVTGVAAQLVFTTLPGITGTLLSPQAVVTIEDAGGNTVTSDTSAVLLSLVSKVSVGPGRAHLHCRGGHTAVAVAGVATFVNCTISEAGSYTLGATLSGLPVAVSATRVTVS